MCFSLTAIKWRKLEKNVTRREGRKGEVTEKIDVLMYMKLFTPTHGQCLVCLFVVRIRLRIEGRQDEGENRKRGKRERKEGRQGEWIRGTRESERRQLNFQSVFTLSVPQLNWNGKSERRQLSFQSVFTLSVPQLNWNGKSKRRQLSFQSVFTLYVPQLNCNGC